MAKKKDDSTLAIALLGLAGLGGLVFLTSTARANPTAVPTAMSITAETVDDVVVITATLTALA